MLAGVGTPGRITHAGQVKGYWRGEEWSMPLQVGG